MTQLSVLEPIEYIVIGHITKDLTAEGSQLGGTATYAALTANSIGVKVGVVTSWGCEIPIGPLQEIPIINDQAENSTTFSNIEKRRGRVQFVHNFANSINASAIPVNWQNPSIVHLGPVVHEIQPELGKHFPNSLICATPQGWLRMWDEHGEVTHNNQLLSKEKLHNIHIAILSIEDVDGDENTIEELAGLCPIFVVTEGYKGSRVYWHGDVRHFNAPKVKEKNPTGAGDIFAAAFFIQYNKTKNPWEAARFANNLAALSVTRSGLDSIPTREEVINAICEVI